MNYELLEALIQGKKEQFEQAADQIWGFAEMRFQEFQSAQLQKELLRREGFEVEEKLGGIPTAFRAKVGSGRPVIGLLGEFDALPKLSQKADLTHAEPEAPDAPGHGCGHHLLGTGCMQAAVAIKDYLLEHPCQGTVIYYGCPGEEGGRARRLWFGRAVLRTATSAWPGTPILQRSHRCPLWPMPGSFTTLSENLPTLPPRPIWAGPLWTRWN